MNENLKFRIGLTLLKGIGPALAKNLVAYTGSEEAVFREKQKNLIKIPGIGENLSKEIAQQSILNRAEKEVEFIVKNNIKPLFYTEKDYPYRLKECPDSPVMIYTKGEVDLNSGKFVAIVGTRNATENGKDICKNLIADLATTNIVIVSGLAYGIDICAHKAALENNLTTIGVVGHGLDRVYPSQHHSTAMKMIDRGALLTEYISGTNPDRQNFVQRNRIIAGICDATIVVESAIKGGALITAELANDYNRDVFAIPGRVNDEWSAGCNYLIKNNKASLIESAEDLMKFMSWEKQDNSSAPVQTMLFPDLSAEEQALFSIIQNQTDGIQLNEIALKTGNPVSRVSSLLLTMEFKGIVKCLPGNLYKVFK